MSEKPASNTKPKKYSSDLRLKVVQRAKELGNYNEVAREFNVSGNSVSSWVKSYERDGIDGLVAKNSRPHHSPKKTSQWIIDKILKKKKENPEMGSKAMSDHLKRFESVDLSPTAIGKLFKKHNICDGDAGYAKSSFYVKGDKDKQLEKTLRPNLVSGNVFLVPIPMTCGRWI